MQPYIGVTGITRPVETKISEGFPFCQRQLALGVLVSFRSIRNLPFDGTWSRWEPLFPPLDRVPDLFSQDPRTANVIHYCPEPGRESCLLQDLLSLNDSWREYRPGFQINWPWPEVRLLDEYRVAEEWATRIILRVDRKAVELAGGAPKTVRDRIYHYAGIVDDILFDFSGGKGIALDPVELTPYLRAVRDAGWGLSLAVAGGLSADTLDSLDPLLEEFGKLSFDAQHKLRNPSDGLLDVQEARRYISKALTKCGCQG